MLELICLRSGMRTTPPRRSHMTPDEAGKDDSLTRVSRNFVNFANGAQAV
ncbi:hypothetical protein [Sphingomonas sp.]